MPMIDIGLKIEIATASGRTAPVTAWRQLKDCTGVPALVQPSAKIATDYIGDDFTGELLGKRGVTGLDFPFAYDGTATGDQYKFLTGLDAADTEHWMRITYPDGTKFEMLVNVEVSLVAVTPSNEIGYTMSVVAIRQSVLDGTDDELIHVVEVGGTDPLEPVTPGD